MLNPTIARSTLQTVLTNTTAIKNLQSEYAINPSRFNYSTYEACDLLLSLTPPLHTRIFMHYDAKGKAPKQTFDAHEISQAIINDSEISDSMKKEIMYISALQMGVPFDELYAIPYVERFINGYGKELKNIICTMLFQECQAILRDNLSI